MTHCCRIILLIVCWLLVPVMAHGASDDCGCSEMRVALKTNLLHDLLLTPDFGVEVRLPGNFSASAEGVWAWWSDDSRHHCWRIYGGRVQARYWLGEKASERSLTGHHLSVYGSVHSFDFEFGKGHGRQTPDVMWGVGVGYGYSWKIAERLNIELGALVGYAEGVVTKYDAQCGLHVCTGREVHRYFGLTDICVSLVWFPGKKTKNNPTLRVE